MNLFLVILASIGLSHIIVDSPLLDPFKNWLTQNKYNKLVEMLNCYQCSGVWAGWAIGILSLFGNFSLLHAFLLGFVNAVLSPLTAVAITYFNLKSTDMLGNDK